MIRCLAVWPELAAALRAMTPRRDKEDGVGPPQNMVEMMISSTFMFRMIGSLGCRRTDHIEAKRDQSVFKDCRKGA